MEPIARKLTVKPDYATLAALALCACFTLSAFIFIPYAGVQNDEALFAAGIYQPAGSEHGIPVFGHKVATMLMSYLGALKTWLYLPIFRVWPPSVYSLRVPVVLIGAATIWIFFAPIWFLMFAVSEIGDVVKTGYSFAEAMLGILSEAIYAPLSAFTIDRVFR